MSILAEFTSEHLGSMAMLAKETGIDLKLLRDFADGDAAPDDAHVRRIRQALGTELPDGAFPHAEALVTALNVTEAMVLAKRDEFLVRPADVRDDDLIRYVTRTRAGTEKVSGWVKVKGNARWERGDLVAFTLKDGSVVECHPGQLVTVARRRAEAD